MKSSEVHRASRTATKVAVLASAVLLGLGSAALAASFGYRSAITIDRTKVGNSGAPSTLSDFPLLFSVTTGNFKTTANGGRVASSSGYDIIFRGLDTTICNGSAPCGLDHEIEKYVASTGEVAAWVRVPSLNTQTASSNTVVYIYYGASDVTSATQRPTAVWSSTFKGVWHLTEDPSGSAPQANDSTSTPAQGTSNGSMPSTALVAGQIGGAWNFNGSTQFIDHGNAAKLGFERTDALTRSVWAKTSSNADMVVMSKTTTSGVGYTFDYLTTTTRVRTYLSANSSTIEIEGSTTNLSNGAFRHAVVTYDGSSTAAGLKIYIDGVLESPTVIFDPLSASILNTLAFQVAAWPGGATARFNGVIDEVRVMKAVRTADEIKTDYNNQSSPWTFYALDTDGVTNPVSAAAFEDADVLRFPDGRVFIGWRAGLEVDNLGFHLWREQGGGKERVTKSLIAGSLLAGARRLLNGSGHNYGIWDPGPAPGGHVSYYVEDLDATGRKTMHGPFVPQDAHLGPDGYQRSALLSEMGASALGRDAGITQGPWLRSGRAPAGGTPVKHAQALLVEPATVKAPWPGSQSPAVKIRVREEGLYRIDQPSLVAAGLDPSVDPRQLALFVDGREQPLRVRGEDDGVFDAVDSIEFYGQGRDAAYTDTSVYWLAAASDKGARLPAELPPPTTSPAPDATGAFPFLVTRRDRSDYFAVLLNGTASNFFGPVVADKPVEQALEVHHRAPGPENAGERLSVTVQGVAEGAHRVKVELNGAPLGVIALEGRNHGALDVAVRGLVDGTNLVRLSREGGEMDVTLVDAISLVYRHAPTADGDRLILTAAGGSPMTVGGFGTGAIRALDVTAPEAPRPLGVSVSSGANGYAATISVPPGETRRIFLAAESALPSPPALEAHAPASWDFPGGADLVIIAPAALAPSLEPLRAAREQQGLVVALVDLQQIYDGFSFGHKDAAAMRGFLAWTQDAWTRRPRFVLLAGDGTFDPRNFLGQDAPDLVPAALIDTSRLETASDDWFADFDEDGRPDIAIGRLPARTPEEAALIVGKILAWREAPGDWKHDLLAVAGWDNVVDFAQQSRWAVAELSPRVRKQELHFDAAAGASAHQRLAADLAAGAMVVNYYGHGSTELWSGILDSRQAGALGNGPRLPVFTLMTCLNGFFQDVFTESLGEALLRAPEGGGVAAFASSGMTRPDDQLELDRRVLGSLFSGQSRTLGDAVLAAKLGTSDNDVRRTWLLLGDPSMPFEAAASSDAAGRSGCRCQMGTRGAPPPFLAVLIAAVCAGACFRSRRRTGSRSPLQRC